MCCNNAAHAIRLLVPQLTSVQIAALAGSDLVLQLALQLPTDIEIQTLAEDGNKTRVTLGEITKGKKVGATICKILSSYSLTLVWCSSSKS